ncbi:MAG: tetratricopeptide repeat protein [Cyclobacteriaceae bacterium]|nr:tetratricopeptide repeat protein [Cyclobacteriaceae bacterium]
MSDETERNTNRYLIGGIVTLLLMALFSALGSFVVWSGLGLSVYFFFLSYRASGVSIFQSRPTDPGAPYQANNPTPPGNNALNKIRVIVPIVFVLMALGIIAAVVVAINSSDDRAEEVVEEVQSSLDPEVNDWVNNGNAYYNQGSYDSASYYYSKALAKWPDHPSALYGKSLIAYAKEDFRTSLQLVRRCKALNSNDPDVMMMLGANHFQLRQLDSARYYLDEAVSMGNQTAWCLWMNGEIYLAEGNRNDARQSFLNSIGADSTLVDSYKRLLEVDPENSTLYRRKLKEFNQ